MNSFIGKNRKINNNRRKFINICGILYTLNIMSREKKSKVDDVVKLRKILDNSSDPNIKELISADEKALDSVRRRLAGDTLKPKSHYDRSFRTFDSLEPRVTIRPKNAVSSR